MKAGFKSGVNAFSLGPFIKSCSPTMIESCGIVGFDFCVIDMEHTPVQPDDLYTLVLAAERRNIETIVRIPEISEKYFKWCRDLGVRYIQIPHVQTKQDAELCVQEFFYSPKGERGLCRFVRAADYSFKDKDEYIKGANEEVGLILQIEGSTGLKNIDDILKVKDIYGIFLGPYDLSQSLGVPGDIWNPKVVAEINGIVEKCRAQNIRVGTFTDTVEGVHHWAKEGLQFIEYGSDLNLFMEGSKLLQNQFNR